MVINGPLVPTTAPIMRLCIPYTPPRQWLSGCIGDGPYSEKSKLEELGIIEQHNMDSSQMDQKHANDNGLSQEVKWLANAVKY